MDLDPRVWLRGKFAEYYSRKGVEAPPRIWNREFGVGNEKKIDYRHMSFRDEKELLGYLRASPPLYISYSAAYYQFPSATPMQKKGMLGSDLIFDFDLGDLPTNCNEKFPSPECLELVKDEVIKLIEEFLVPDFGFSEKEILVFFSGSKGYHIHIRNDYVQDLDQRARMEIVDYVTGNNINPRFFFRMDGKTLVGPKIGETGWRGRICKTIADLLSNGDVEEIHQTLGIRRSVCKKLLAKKDDVISGLERGIWSVLSISKETWYTAVSSLALKQGVRLDRNVTIDMSRLIRLPTSLHGFSGLSVCPVKALERFKPLDDAIVFGRKPVPIRVNKNIDFYLGGYQKIDAGEQELPEYLAVYLIAKGEGTPLG